MSGERTVRVRIAVAVQADGRWFAWGGDRVSDNDAADVARNGGCHSGVIRWVEADVPLPSEATIEGEVRE